MQVKNDYIGRDSALLGVQFYLEEKLTSQHLRIYEFNGKDVEVVGTISVPVVNILEVLDTDATDIVKTGVNASDAMIYIEFCHLQEATNSKIVSDFDAITHQRERLIELTVKYIEMCVEGVLNKLKEYEEKLHVPTVIDDDITFATLTAVLLEEDFPTVATYQIANELFGKLYSTFCRECGKMHNPFRRCGSVELK